MLAKMSYSQQGCLLFMLQCAVYLQEQDGGNNRNAHLLRILTPVLKLFTAKECIWVISEALECFGALGYLEDSGIPKIYRDAQVTPIWEGTTNTLSLDFLHTFVKLEKSKIGIEGVFAGNS